MNNVINENWRLLGFGFLMTFFSGPGQTYLISLYSGEIRQEFNLSHGDFGAIYSLATLFSAAVILWSGRLIDSHDVKKLSLVVVCLLSCGMWMLSISSNVIMLLISLFLLRQTGQGLMTHISATVMIRYFDRIKGKTMAFSSIGYVAAEAILPVITISLITWLGWRESLQLSGFLIILMMLPCIVFLLRKHHQTHQRYIDNLVTEESSETSGIRKHWTRAEVLKDRRFYIALPAIMAPSLVFTGFFFHQIHLIEIKGWGMLWWGKAFMLYAGCAFISTLVYGPLVDRFSAVRLLPICLLPFSAGLFLIYAFTDQWAGIGFLMLTGLTSGGATVVSGPFLSEIYGNRHLGAIKSIGTTVMVFASALSPFAMGYLIDFGVHIEYQALAASIYIIIASFMVRVAFFHKKSMR